MNDNRFIKLDTSGPRPKVMQLLLPIDISKRKAMSGFYSSLHSLFGPPSILRHEGYSYMVQDVETGAVFFAELNQFGQGYYGNPADKASVEAFEALRKKTVLVDCSFEYAHDFGRTALGCEQGELFERHYEE